MSCLHHLFEREADRCPLSPAIVSGDAVLSYADVEARANQLARYLRSRGVAAGELVGLMVERSPDAVVAILAILKAGAAYLPLDPSHPAERVRHILAEASIATVVSEQALGPGVRAVLDGAGVNVVTVDEPSRPWRDLPTVRLADGETGVSAANLCYVLYTSGSTGRPKGVMTEHRNVVAFVAAFNQVVQLGPRDRVFQGFSLGFDGSVEEIWMAFSNGAALVVPPRGSARFGDDLAALITRGAVSVFSTVPTSLATMSETLPTVRLLIVSGERCPPEAVNRWAAPARRMLNVYGPTETTVNTTVAECRPDRAVTIGRPLRGYGLHVLDESGRVVERGEKGELFITGSGLARGYLAQPQLTAERFPALPAASAAPGVRAYRTGDLVSVDESGDLLFHGRLDNQVKVRGYRIELSEIESVLGEDDAIRTAVVTARNSDGGGDGDNGGAVLAAYVLAKDPVAGIDRNRVLARLVSRLPAYMVPAFLDVVDSFPTLASGKVDRRSLPPPVSALVRTDRAIRAPGDALESELLATYARLLRNDAISIDDDFFMTLGGYSLLAAQLVSELRKELGVQVAIRDVYSHPTIAALAAHLRTKKIGSTAAESTTTMTESAGTASVAWPGAGGDRLTGRSWTTVADTSLAPRRRLDGIAARAVRSACAAAQALSLYLVYAVLALPYWGLHFSSIAWRAGRISFSACAGAWLLVLTGTWPVFLALSVAAKWVLIGRYRPGTYRLWGWYSLRFWLAKRFQLISGSAFLVGTPFLPIYLRAMGAKIGRGCTIATPFFGAFDLLRIGDDTSVGVETQILGYRIEDGLLHVGSVDIGSRCFIGTHAALGLDTWMSDDSRLDDQSLLPDGTRIPAGESRRGSPAQPAEVHVPIAVPVPVPADAPPSLRRRPVMVGALQLLALTLVMLSLLPTLAPAWALIALAERTDGLGWLLAALPLAGTATIVAFCLALVVLNHLVLPSVRAGVYRVDSVFYVRKWCSDLLMHLSRTLARPIYTTIYLPAWLRLMGAQIGRRAEISTVSQISPKLTRIGAQSFFADGSIIGGNRIHRGLFQLAESRIGRRSFVGNSAILPVGASLGDDCLLGCLSAPPPAHPRSPDGSEWLGSPSFALPHRPRVGGFDRAVTHEPTPKLIAQRLLIDGLRIVLPVTILAGALVGFSALASFAYDRLSLVAWLLTVPAIEMALAAAMLACVVVAKKILVGRFTPTVKPLWSIFVWLNEALNGTYETVATPVLTLLLGTPFAAWWLRRLGCKIGRDVYLETTLFSEFDLVEIGDGVALNAGAVIQNHLFEDRIMKASVVRIGDRCTVGNMAVVLYDTDMKAGSSIGSLSLLMKGETLAAGTDWVGIPTAQAVPRVVGPYTVPVAAVASGVAADVAWLEQSL